MFGVDTSDLQESDVAVEGTEISGTIKYMSADNGITAKWGYGNFLVLKFSDVPSGVTSVKVGLQPSQGSGLVELLGDPDMNGIFKIHDTSQSFIVQLSDGSNTKTIAYDLSGLTLEGSGV